MATNLGIDEKLLAQALKLGGRHTKRETVNEALAEYIAHRKRLKSLDLIGRIDIDPHVGLNAKPRAKSGRRRR